MHRFAGVSRRSLAREVGITCVRGLYSAPFLRGESVIPCAKGRYPLRERSAFLALKVCIFKAVTADSCVSGRYSFAAAPTLRSRGYRSTLPQPTFFARGESCARGRYSCGEAPTRSRPCVRGRYSDLSLWGCLGSPVNCASTRLPPRSRASLRQPRSLKACVSGRC